MLILHSNLFFDNLFLTSGEIPYIPGIVTWVLLYTACAGSNYYSFIPFTLYLLSYDYNWISLRTDCIWMHQCPKVVCGLEE